MMRSLFLRLHWRSWLLPFAFIISILISLPFLLAGTIHFYYQSHIFTRPEDVPAQKVALVLGAGVYSDGTPSPILQDRIDAAVQLYKAGKVQKLIMSGDNRVANYNEPEAMTRVASAEGVPIDDIQPDYAGRRTYDSCWRAKNIFSQDKIIIVTQSFHMTRAIFLCENLGIESEGFIADQPRYSLQEWMYWSVRDMVSLTLSTVDIYVRDPDLVKGEKIPL